MKKQILFSTVFCLVFCGSNILSISSQSKKYAFRTRPLSLHDVEIEKLIKKYDFFHGYKNKNGTGIVHSYFEKNVKGNKVVIDEATGLMWQENEYQQVSMKELSRAMKRLSRNGFAGYYDWRLPTLEEALSLLESNSRNFHFYIDPVFNLHDGEIWTADRIISLSGKPVVVLINKAEYGTPANSYRKFSILAVRTIN